MKDWHIGLGCSVAILLLLTWPMLSKAEILLGAWPLGTRAPKLHYDCGRASGEVRVRVELAGFVTGDYVIVCSGA